MQSKALILSVFAVWCLISWRWYVCGVKQMCSSSAGAPPVGQQYTPPPQADTLGIEYDSTPARTATNATNAAPASVEPNKTPASTATAAPRPSAALSATPANLDRVQIEEIQDHVVIHFPYNSTRKEDNDAIDDYLAQLADYLKQTGKTATITGHTDMIGDAKANLSIGLQRANQIRSLLTAKGVAAKQVKTISKGESKPVATNDTPRGRYLNRRVEIRINP